MNLEAPQEHDGRQHMTAQEGLFFELVYCQEEHFKLGGVERTFPAGTKVHIVLRANGRLLLQTPDKFHRWADRAFLDSRKKVVSTPANS